MSEREAPRGLLLPGDRIPRHRHARAYATVVLAGGYDEAGEAGRWRVQAGDVLLHAPFSAHCDLAPARGAKVLNLPLPDSLRYSSVVRAADPDRLVRLAERDPAAAACALLETCTPKAVPLADAPDLLAQVLSAADACNVERWSREHGVCRQTAFRWFRAIYGVGPARYRVEARARRAWRLIVDGDATLAAVAAQEGFADQAHMCRDVASLTGRSPGAWRRARVQPLFKTG